MQVSVGGGALDAARVVVDGGKVSRDLLLRQGRLAISQEPDGR